MVERRRVMAGGLFAGLVGALTPSAATRASAEAYGVGSAGGAAAGGGDDNTAILRRMLEEIELHRPTYGTRYGAGHLSVRNQQQIFLKAQARYPEYIDVGLNVWDQVYEWHIMYQVPVKIGRLPDGAYSMPYLLTTLVLRPNVDANYVSAGYDAR